MKFSCGASCLPSGKSLDITCNPTNSTRVVLVVKTVLVVSDAYIIRTEQAIKSIRVENLNLPYHTILHRPVIVNEGVQKTLSTSLEIGFFPSKISNSYLNQ